MIDRSKREDDDRTPEPEASFDNVTAHQVKQMQYPTCGKNARAKHDSGHGAIGRVGLLKESVAWNC
jgi:hypothetical protein